VHRLPDLCESVAAGLMLVAPWRAKEKGTAMGKAILLASVAAMLLAYAGMALAQTVRGKSALPRSPTKREILFWTLFWTYFWSTHVRHRPLYRNRAPPFSWPVTTT
jgi:hypothetical protein